MIRANNPEIDVESLMERVAAEAARLRAGTAVEERRNAPRDVAADALSRTFETHTAVCLTVELAEKLNVPRSALPRRFERLPGLFSAPVRFAQRVYNYASKQQREINARQNGALSGLAAMSLETAEYARRTSDLIRSRDEAAATVSARVAALETNRSDRADFAHARLDESDRALKAVSDRLELAFQQLAALNAQLARTPDGTEIQLRIVDAVREVERRLADVQDRGLRADALLRSELAAVNRSTGTAAPGTERVAAGAQVPDALYEAIEDRFRGSTDHVRSLLGDHLQRILDAGAVSSTAPLLDIGCGRGEWLELLREKGVAAFGIDTNPVAVSEAIVRGVDAREGDLLGTLGAAEDASIGAITAFHVVEHLPFGVLVEMLREALRVLTPGGRLILETPNPGNVLVATQTFWLDPTHVRPIPQQLLAFVVEAAGFAHVETVELHAPSAAAFGIDSPLAPLNAYFSAAQDYAIVAVRPD